MTVTRSAGTRGGDIGHARLEGRAVIHLLSGHKLPHIVCVMCHVSCVTVSHRSHGILQLNHQMREQRFSGICCWKQNNLLYILFVLRINTVEKAGENASNVWKCPIKIPIISL